MKFFNYIIVAACAVIGSAGLALAQLPSADQQANAPVNVVPSGPNHAPSAGISSGQGEIKALIVTGTVQAKDADGKLTPIARGDSVSIGSTVITGNDGIALLVFSNGAAMQIKANSSVKVVKFNQDPFDKSQGEFLRLTKDPSKSTTQLDIAKGTMAGEVKKLNLDANSSFTVNTPAGSAGIRGTIVGFTVDVDASGAVTGVHITCANGMVQFFPARVAGVPGRLNAAGVNVSAGGQVNVAVTSDAATGNVSSLTITGATFSGATAQSAIDALYAAVNEVLVQNGQAPLPVPQAAAPNAPVTSGAAISTPAGTSTPPTNPTISG
jgi:hypothetical protein